jgi:hypothetical protein
MALSAHSIHQYHVFLASPGDVGQYVRRAFADHNRHTAQPETPSQRTDRE